MGLSLGACSSSHHREPRPPATTPARPRLVVLVVIDQLPSWELDRVRQLSTLGALLRDGAVVERAELPYATTFTACGHAAIGTGAPPSVTGIVGNTWYRQAEGRERAAEYDSDAPVFVVGEPDEGKVTIDDAASGKALRVEGLAEALRRGTGGAGRAVAIALKPRAAAFMLGPKPDLAIWYEAGAGGMTTTRAYASDAPPWLVQLAKDQPTRRFFTRAWSIADADAIARATGTAVDVPPGEGSVHGLGIEFPHDLSKSDRPGRAFLHTPFADEAVTDTALAALAALQLGQRTAPDLLAIGYNAHDYAGHVWGPSSWELFDLERRLDAQLARLIGTLDRRLGRDRWALVVTSDHGMTPVVEQQLRPDPHRIPTATVVAAIDAALGPRPGAVAGAPPASWVARIVSSNVYFATPVDAAQLAVAANAAAAIPGVAAVGPTAAISGGCEKRTGLARALCLSAVSGESGELYVVPRAGSTITEYPTGASHDAPFDDNRQVPIIVRAPGLPHQMATGSLLQVAPTVAALLGIAPPAAATEPPLFGLARPRAH